MCDCVCALSRSAVWLFATPWTAVCQFPLSVGFSRQDYCSGAAIPFSGGSFRPRDWTQSPALQAGSLPSEPPGKPQMKMFYLTYLLTYCPIWSPHWALETWPVQLTEWLLNSLYNLLHLNNYRWLVATAVIKFVWSCLKRSWLYERKFFFQKNRLKAVMLKAGILQLMEICLTRNHKMLWGKTELPYPVALCFGRTGIGFLPHY